MYNKYVEELKIENKFRTIIFSTIISLLLILVPAIVIQYILLPLFEKNLDSIINITSIFAIIITVFLELFIINKLNKIKFNFANNTLKDFLKGSFWGFLLLSLVFFCIYIVGAIEVRYMSINIKLLLMGLIFFIFQGTWEEMIFRYYLMPIYSKIFNNHISVIVISTYFVILHLSNSGISYIAILNIFLASVLISLVYINTGSLVFVGLAHGIWNYTQGFIYGSKVSGIHIKGAIINSTSIKYPLLSGADFGFEASIITSILAIIIIIILIKRLK